MWMCITACYCIRNCNKNTAFECNPSISQQKKDVENHVTTLFFIFLQDVGANISEHLNSSLSYEKCGYVIRMTRMILNRQYSNSGKTKLTARTQGVPKHTTLPLFPNKVYCYKKASVNFFWGCYLQLSPMPYVYIFSSAATTKTSPIEILFYTVSFGQC